LRSDHEKKQQTYRFLILPDADRAGRGMGLMSHDAALKEKAKEMYVISGLTVRNISILLPEVPKGTLWKWRRDDNWKKQRKERVTRTVGRRERIERTIDLALDSLEVKFDPKLASSIIEFVAALKSNSTFGFTEEPKQKLDNKKKGLTPETLKEIEEKLLGW
jgi:hypothetical protein